MMSQDVKGKPVPGFETADQLLVHVRTLYEFLEASRQEPFNVFTALRKSHDEVNLHSRFLHALLSHRDAEGRRPYLRRFLASIEGTSQFESGAESAVVRREHQHIDLLITHRNPDWAVVIENKIWAGDQPGQIGRYYLSVRRYRPQSIILYLTPNGRKPEKQSAEYEWDGKPCTAPYVCVSYRDDVLPWLRECQQRAVEDPSLRESIAQYRSVVEQLTGHPLGENYMQKLTDLCVKNMPLVMDLTAAMVDARRKVLRDIWTRIDEAVSGRLGMESAAFSRKTKGLALGRDRIRTMLKPPRVIEDWHGLLWPLRPSHENGTGKIHPQPALGAEINGSGRRLMYGVRCHDDNHETIENALAEFRGDSRQTNDWWPWVMGYGGAFDADTKREVWEQLAMLANEPARLELCADEVASTLLEIEEILQAKAPSLFDRG